ncbi:MAG TPA: hypothetical protein VF412_03200 [Bdellovibrio sp.]|uniref:hypothetical protein n=1 Tax=Bdellovibrio sp. TaxID=28201 RepID=UPI002F0D7768
MLIGVKAHAERPDWTKQNTYKKDGSILTLVCKGAGPSLDLARSASMNSCKATAANEANSGVTIKSMSIETQSDASFHQEVSSVKKVTNLSCDILSEYFSESEGSTEVFLLCRFDLSKSNVAAVPDATDDDEAKGIIKNPNSLVQSGENQDEGPKAALIQSSARHIILTVMPVKCESIIIKSKSKSRSVRCDANPMAVLVDPSVDHEIIIRANGFLPKHVKLQDRKPAGFEEPTEIEVLLEK